MSSPKALWNPLGRLVVHRPKKFGVRQAERFNALLKERIQTLKTAPLIGKTRDDVSVVLRMLIEAPYLIFYRIDDGRIIIADVVHGSRDDDASIPEAKE